MKNWDLDLWLLLTVFLIGTGQGIIIGVILNESLNKWMR